jgi:hypothetical protein
METDMRVVASHRESCGAVRARRGVVDSGEKSQEVVESHLRVVIPLT